MIYILRCSLEKLLMKIIPWKYTSPWMTWKLMWLRSRIAVDVWCLGCKKWINPDKLPVHLHFTK